MEKPLPPTPPAPQSPHPHLHLNGSGLFSLGLGKRRLWHPLIKMGCPWRGIGVSFHYFAFYGGLRRIIEKVVERLTPDCEQGEDGQGQQTQRPPEVSWVTVRHARGTLWPGRSGGEPLSSAPALQISGEWGAQPARGEADVRESLRFLSGAGGLGAGTAWPLPVAGTGGSSRFGHKVLVAGSLQPCPRELRTLTVQDQGPEEPGRWVSRQG